MTVAQRINRVLCILSYVSQHQGVPVQELAARVDLKPRELLRELDFILLIGKPPFQPDDYIDIYVEEDRVYIEFDQLLNRPLRFSRPEAMALLMSLQLLDPEVDPETVESLEHKIQKLISKSVDRTARWQDRIAFAKHSTPVSDQFEMLHRAIAKRRKVRIDYYSLTRNKTARRTIRPYLLTKSLGYWYLSGYCELRKDLRTFKFERILSVEPLGQSFPAPEDLDVKRFQKRFLRLEGRNKVEIYFAPRVAPWIKEQWVSSVRDTDDGGVILQLSSETMEFPSRLVLNYAPDARPLTPPELIRKVQSDAAGILEMYQSEPAAGRPLETPIPAR